MILVRKAILEAHGSSGYDVITRLLNRGKQQFGSWPSVWRVLVAETVRSRPTELPDAWHFEPVGEPLSRLYQQRAALGLPEQYTRLPQEFWVDTYEGAQKLPAAAAICYALHSRQLNQARETALNYLLRSVECIEDTQKFIDSLKQRVQVESGNLLVVLCASAGGSTGHAGILNSLDYWLSHDYRPHIVILLIGPECGTSEDGHRTEHANAIRLLASIQHRAAQGEVWPFILDGTLLERERILEAASQFLWSLLAGREDANMIRQLVNGFGIASRVEGGKPPRIWCQLDVYCESDDAHRLLRLQAAIALKEAISKEVLPSNDTRA